MSKSTPASTSQLASHNSSSKKTTKANRIGSCLFCPSCGTLLDLPGDEDEIACEQCGRKEPASCGCLLSYSYSFHSFMVFFCPLLVSFLFNHPFKFCFLLAEEKDVVFSWFDSLLYAIRVPFRLRNRPSISSSRARNQSFYCPSAIRCSCRRNQKKKKQKRRRAIIALGGQKYRT